MTTTLLPHHASILLAAASGAALAAFALVNREDRRVERRLMRRNKTAFYAFRVAYLVLTLTFAFNVRFVVRSLLSVTKIGARLGIRP